LAEIAMAALLRHNAARHGAEAPALIYSGEVVSWGELEARANRRARLFHDLGVRRGDFVTLALANSNFLYECSFAVWKLGATPNVVSHRLPDAEFSAIIELVEPSLVVTETVRGVAGRAATSAQMSADNYSSEPLREGAPSTFWKAMTSGGSTGRPKVIVDHRRAVWDVALPHLQQRPDEVMLNPGPLYHNAPFIFSHIALFLGNTVIGMSRFDAEEALRLIETHRVAWVNFVPTMMHRIWSLPPQVRQSYDLSSLRVVWHMAAPMPVWLKEQWIDWLGPERIFELYGGTERQGSTVISGVEWIAKKGSVGRLATAGRLQVFRDDGVPCKPAEAGEVYFQPEGGVTYHYIGAEAKVRDGGWESIGDIGWLDEDGYLFLADRRTDLILRGGANVYPAEVEAALDAHPGVASSVIVGLADPDLGQRVHALVQPQPDAELDPTELDGFLAERLVRYKLPESYEFVADPLRDDAGKVRRSALRDERAQWLREERPFRLRPDRTVSDA
jgi:bile acid-coenzyme A ligase